MLRLQIFTDGSVNTKLKFGYGAYFVVSNPDISVDSLKDTVKIKRFTQTSSTKLEETVSLINRPDLVITVHTDSQNIVSLPGRRDRLEQRNYFSSKNKRLNNYELYREFYQLTSRLNCSFVKVAGHQVSSKKDKVDRLFSLVDQASRRALREESYSSRGSINVSGNIIA